MGYQSFKTMKYASDMAKEKNKPILILPEP